MSLPLSGGACVRDRISTVRASQRRVRVTGVSPETVRLTGMISNPEIPHTVGLASSTGWILPTCRTSCAGAAAGINKAASAATANHFMMGILHLSEIHERGDVTARTIRRITQQDAARFTRVP